MKSEELEEKGRRAEEYLRIIERSRLLYNTSVELGEVVGFSIESGNGLARKGGRSAFMKDAVLREHFFQSILDDESYKKINAYPEDEYSFTLCLAAITEDALYIWQDEGSYLRVPKSLNRQLSDVHFGESVGFIPLHQGHGRQKETVFLSFDDRRLYYEVTTAKQRQELGIEVVERIE